VVLLNALVLITVPGFGHASASQCGGSSGSGGSGSGGSGGGCADLSTRAVQSQNPIPKDNRLFYVFQVTNLGPSFAYGVRMLVLLPKSATAQWLTTSEGYCDFNPRLHAADCQLDFLNAGSKAAVIAMLIPRATGIIKAKAGVSEDFPSDPNKKNNVASISTRVTP
jgi:hypothetical protein